MAVNNTVSPNTTAVPLVSVTLSQPVTCKTLDGITGPCGFTIPPDPTYSDKDKTCNNVVLEVMIIKCLVKSTLLQETMETFNQRGFRKIALIKLKHLYLN